MATASVDWAGPSQIITAQSVTNGSTHTTSAIDLDLKHSAAIKIQVQYGGTANADVEAFILRLINGSTYETTSDAPYSRTVGPRATSSTRVAVINLRAADVDDCKLLIRNNSGATVTVDAWVRTSTVSIT